MDENSDHQIIEIGVIDIRPSTSSYNTSWPNKSDPSEPKSIMAVSHYTPTARQTFDLDRKPSKPRAGCPETCLVCGAQATGYHYEVPSCTGCKTFFRRTIKCEAKFFCKRNDQCFAQIPIDRGLTVCKACRFKKCIAAGMNPLGLKLHVNNRCNKILNEILADRAKIFSTVKKSSAEIPRVMLLSQEIEICRILDDLIHVEAKMDKFRKCRYNPDQQALPPLEELIDRSCYFDVADKLGPMPGWPLSETTSMSVRDKVEYFRKGQKIPYDERAKHWITFDLLTTIEYSKSFPWFHQLSKSDKTTLLREKCLMCADLLNIFYSYSQNSPDVLNPDGTRHNMDVGSSGAGSDVLLRMQETKRSLLQSFIRERMTQKEYVLLKAMILCNGNVAGISWNGKRILVEQQQRYARLLFTVCMAEKGLSEGPARFAAMLGIVDALERLVEKQRDAFTLITVYFPESPKLIPLFGDLIAG